MTNFEAFFSPSTLKSKNLFIFHLRVSYVYIEESFDTIFNMGYGGRTIPPPLHGLLVGKIGLDERVK